MVVSLWRIIYFRELHPLGERNRLTSKKVAHARLAASEVELFETGVGIAHFRDLLERIVYINFQLIAVGIEKIDALRHAVVDREADWDVVLLELAIGGAQVVHVLEPKGEMRKPDVVRIGCTGTLTDLGKRQLVMVAPIAGQEDHLRFR